jgi:histone H3
MAPKSKKSPRQSPKKSPRQSPKKSPRQSPSKNTDKRKHRYKPGTVALRNIRKYQKGDDKLIPYAPFNRLVRSVAQDYKQDVRFTKDAIDMIQVALENKLVKLMHDANLVAIHSGRQTLAPKDLQLVKNVLDTTMVC